MVQLQEIEHDLVSLGFQLLAASPDPIEKLQPTIEKHKLTYELVSDGGLAAARRFGIVFRLDADTLERYKGFGIELQGTELPVPAVFVIDSAGKIHFSYANPDYKLRLDTDVLLAAAAAAVKKE